MSPSASEFLVWTSKHQRQMRQTAAIQRQTTLWQLDGWAKAVARTSARRLVFGFWFFMPPHS